MTLNTYEQGLVKELAEMAMREHYRSTEAENMCCPKSPHYPKYVYDAGWACDCGAEDHNTEVVALYKALVEYPPICGIEDECFE